MILEPKNIKPGTVSTVSPSISHEVMGPDAMILVFFLFFFLIFKFYFIFKLYNIVLVLPNIEMNPLDFSCTTIFTYIPETCGPV